MIPPPPTSTLFPYTTLFRSFFFADTTVNIEPDAETLAEIATATARRSEEHTSELQSPYDLVCRLLLEKKKVFLLGYVQGRPSPPYKTNLRCLRPESQDRGRT